MNTDKNWKIAKHETARSGILDAARRMIRQTGAGSLALRAVARDLGLTAPALYHYFASRDDLVTALIVDSAASFAASQKTALDESQRHGLWRVQDLGLAYRAWALAHPESFSLLFGDPVPGYLAPLEQVQPAMAPTLLPLVRVLAEARAEGELAWPILPPAPPGLTAALNSWNQTAQAGDADVLYLAMTIASRVQGLMMIELGRQLPPWFVDGRELFEREIIRICLEHQRRQV